MDKLFSGLSSFVINLAEILAFFCFFSSLMMPSIFGVVFFGTVVVSCELITFWIKNYHKKSVVKKQVKPDKKITTEDLREMLEDVVNDVEGKVSEAILNKVIRVRNNLLILLWYLDKMELNVYELHIVKQTITDYLPKMLTTYLELQPDFAQTQKISNGNTAQEVLIEQLDILDEQIQNIVVSVNIKEAES
ncbi:MAG: hypothetical protein GQ569_13430 [Methylococcaceae bacterium]|nr:hypothetical protein [Methylococcaceae bacterium]